MIRKCLYILSLCLCLAVLTTLPALAAEAETDGAVVEASGFSEPAKISDGKRSTYSRTTQDAVVTVSRHGGIGALYIEFDRIPTVWTLTDPATGKSVSCGENAFLHEYVNVIALFCTTPEELVLSFEQGTAIAEIYVFSAGEMPDWVQIWQPPCDEADLMLLSTHSDDEQLFFAGILPYYAIERQLSVQVVYSVQHFEVYGEQNHQRPHEQLDGLWTVGIRNYPIISEFPDLYAESKDRNTALAQAKSAFKGQGVSYDDFVRYITECIRRVKPLVVVSHDMNGEYGHGAHVLTVAALTEAIVCAAEADRYPESAAEYGTWSVEKTYLHLFPENPIVMDLDTPLESLGGKTPFEVTQDGFRCHKSQHWTWFYKWIYGTSTAPIKKAADIQTYSPCLYGLYASSVGADTVGGDFFENVTTYPERAAARAKAEAEAKAKAEAEARAKAEAEAKAKAEAEAKAKAEAEAKAKAEAEAKAKAEAEAAAKAKAEADAARAAKQRRAALIAVGLTGAAIVAILLFRLFQPRGKRIRKD